MTRGFSRALTIGEGVFECVYRGVVRVHADEAPNSKMDVAVKQLKWVPWAEWDQPGVWTCIFHMRPHSIGETRFLFVKN